MGDRVAMIPVSPVECHDDQPWLADVIPNP